MLITAVCPLCRTSYQVQASLRGQALRCPNTLCRHVFIVPAEPPPAKAGNGAQSGSVGDVVPILPAEIAGGEAPPQTPTRPPAAPNWRDAPPAVRKPAENGPTPAARPPQPASKPAQPAPRPVQPAPKPAQPAAPPSEAPTWRDAPPPVRQGEAPSPPAPAADTHVPRQRPSADTVPGKPRPAPARSPAPETLPATTSGPVEMPPGTWDPPPVRRGQSAAPPVANAPESPAETGGPKVSRRRARNLMIFILLGLVAALGAGGIVAWKFLVQSEEDLFADATKDFQDGKFGVAGEQFKRLAEHYPDSENRPTYLFLQDWCALAARLFDPQAEPLPTLDALAKFLKDHKSDPLLKTHAHDVGAAFVPFVESFGRRNASPTGTEPMTVLGRIDQVRPAVKGAGKDALSQADEDRLDKVMKTVREAVENWDKRNRVMAQLRGLEPTAQGIREALRIINERKEFFHSPQDPEVKGLMDKLYEGHLAGVGYEKAGQPDHAPVPRSDTDPSIVIDPLLQGTPGGAPAGDPIVLALARGVLYALHQSNGTVKWARRVGIDTTALPVRVPGSAVARERILVLSSDSATLTAMDDDGNQLWQYRLSSPCLGRPVVVDQLAYLPTYDGAIHEIELARGGLIGRFRLGQHLTLGGAYDPKSRLLYFAAEDSCVYVLDVAAHRCPLILYTNHPTGSLRSEPVVVSSVTPPVGGNPTPGYLVLNQAEGLDATRLRVYELPLKDAHQSPLTLKPEPRLAGWTWFSPTRDDEKLVTASDRGVLGMFGIKQANNRDQALFPMLGAGGLALDSFLVHKEEGGRSKDEPRRDTGSDSSFRGGRSQVVQVNGDDVWVLARGQMLRLGIAWNQRAGLRPVAGWKEAKPLGEPLHASQIEEDPAHGRSTLFVVTQPLDQQTCVATAVNDEDGKVFWQRQLGLVCQGEPLHLTLHEGSGEPLLLALDQGGSLFALDPGRFPLDGNAPWQSGGQSVAPSLADNPRVAPLLLPGPDGHSVLEIACPGAGTYLHVREIKWSGKGRQLTSNDRKLALPSPPAGRPVVVGSQLMMPLSGGSVARLPLPIPPDARLDEGPPWRPTLASPDTPGHITALGGELFLTTDGGRGLTCWKWPPGTAEYKSLPMDIGDNATLNLPDRVVAAPVVLPAPAGGATRVCVADSGGAVRLLRLLPDGRLNLDPGRVWDLKGQVTGGLFVRTLAGDKVRVGCVVDGRRLVWLDPAKSEPAWEYQARKAIVGQPQVVDGILVVADQSGLVTGLDPATGQPVGPGHQLQGSVVPAASPVAFGPRRLFVPLSDGTGVLLTLDRLNPPPK